MRPSTTNIDDFETLRKAGQTHVAKAAYFHRTPHPVIHFNREHRAASTCAAGERI